MEKNMYKRKRDFTVCGIVGVCATTKNEFVREVFFHANISGKCDC